MYCIKFLACKGRSSVKFVDLLENKALIAAILAWFIAQVIKVVLVLVEEKRFDFGKMISSGGMPSSHSALMTAMTASVGKTMGLDSVAFAIAAVTSLVVMYDAANVRREAGKHAELLNKIARDLYPDNHMNQEKLKELLGHKQIEVAVGAILGITIGIWL